jgi:hypothetical protein
MAKRNAKADFAYMNAIWAPHADEEAFRMMVDWHHWVSYARILGVCISITNTASQGFRF